MTRKGRQPWYKNLSENVLAEAAKFGAPPGEAAALKGARQAELAAEKSTLRQIRARVRNWKTLDGYAGSGAEAALRLKLTGAALDPASYKPVIRAAIEAGRIRIDFDKRGVSGLAIYSRLRGAGQWRRLGTDTRAPFWDSTAPAQAGAAEAREYVARGLKGDEEIGVDSDIISIVHPG